MWPPAAPLVPKGPPSAHQTAPHQPPDGSGNVYLHDAAVDSSDRGTSHTFDGTTTTSADDSQPDAHAEDGVQQQQQHSARPSGYHREGTDDGTGSAAYTQCGVHSQHQHSQHAQSDAGQPNRLRDGGIVHAASDRSFDSPSSGPSGHQLLQPDSSHEMEAAQPELANIHSAAQVPAAASHRAGRHSTASEPAEMAGNSIGRPTSASNPGAYTGFLSPWA